MSVFEWMRRVRMGSVMVAGGCAAEGVEVDKSKGNSKAG